MFGVSRVGSCGRVKGDGGALLVVHIPPASGVLPLREGLVQALDTDDVARAGWRDHALERHERREPDMGADAVVDQVERLADVRIGAEPGEEAEHDCVDGRAVARLGEGDDRESAHWR